MKTHVYLSPHLDDAVFSCSGSMLTEIRSGVKVVVLTLFSGTGRESSKPFQHRPLEDDEALRILGASTKRLNLPDAFYRRATFYRMNKTTASFARLMQLTHPADRAYGRIVLRKVEAALEKLNPDRVYAPLGVGAHIDHRLTFLAAVSLLRRWEFKFYEDRPYALIPSAIRFRFMQIGWRPAIGRGTEDMRSSRKDVICKRYLRGLGSMGLLQGKGGAIFQREIRREGRSRHTPERDARAEIFRLPPRDLKVTGKAIAAYRSQAFLIFGSPTHFFDKIQKQGQERNEPSRYFERYWLID
jgi:LmbE family N-acetylglucosaminyl deacetylase